MVELGDDATFWTANMGRPTMVVAVFLAFAVVWTLVFLVPLPFRTVSRDALADAAGCSVVLVGCAAIAWGAGIAGKWYLMGSVLAVPTFVPALCYCTTLQLQGWPRVRRAIQNIVIGTPVLLTMSAALAVVVKGSGASYDATTTEARSAPR